MSRQPTSGEVAVLRVLTQQLEGIRRQLAEQDRQHERPRTAAPRSAPVAEIWLDDWDALLSAVKARLRSTVGESLMWQFNGAAAPWQASVLECVDALDQLQRTLSHALAGQGQIAWHEPNSQLPALPTLDALQQRLDYGLSSAGTVRRATGAAGLGSRDTQAPG